MLEDMCKEIDAKEIDLDQLKQDFAEKLCPYKVGDIGIIKGYSHTGKRGVITKIVYKRGMPRHTYEAFVDVFRKDGSKSQFRTSIFKDNQFDLI